MHSAASAPLEALADDAADDGDETDDYSDDEPLDEPDDEPEALAATADVTDLHDREPGGLRDNLRLIKGIGPAIEKTLNELGIFRYHQIAEMTEYDIDRVAQRLKGFSTRIYREDWIGQARELQLKKSGT
jgi:predicted flap endonuclease-1-like 5' DNA nuclease